jgi:hypothetical protein
MWLAPYPNSLFLVLGPEKQHLRGCGAMLVDELLDTVAWKNGAQSKRRLKQYCEVRLALLAAF